MISKISKSIFGDIFDQKNRLNLFILIVAIVGMFSTGAWNLFIYFKDKPDQNQTTNPSQTLNIIVNPTQYEMRTAFDLIELFYTENDNINSSIEISATNLFGQLPSIFRKSKNAANQLVSKYEQEIEYHQIRLNDRANREKSAPILGVIAETETMVFKRRISVLKLLVQKLKNVKTNA